MNGFVRWCRFNLVGAAGSVVQLTTLAVLNRCFPHRYLVCSAVAIEITLIHNFMWHLHYTWRDRGPDTSTLSRLGRFQFGNGLISLFGNVVLVRLLVGEAHLPIVVSNGIAILCCSMSNYAIGQCWVFRKPKETASEMLVS